MPYGTITVTSGSYEPRSPGIYQKSGIVFGQPTNEFRIRGASSPGKDGLLRGSIIRVLEKDIVVGSTTSRIAAFVSTNIAAPPQNFTGTELDAMLADQSEFITAAIISRILTGEV